MHKISPASLRKQRIKLLILGIGLILLAIGLGSEYYQIQQKHTAVNLSISLDLSNVTPVLRIGGYETIKAQVDTSGLPEINNSTLVIGVVDLSTGNYAKGWGIALFGGWGYNCDISNRQTSYEGLAVCVVNTQYSQSVRTTFGVKAPSVVGEWRLKAVANLTDNNSSKLLSIREFTLPRIRVYSDANLVLLVPPSVTAQVDGAEQEIGSIPLNLTLGRHSLSVPQTVSPKDTYLKFIGWYDYVTYGNGTNYRSTNLTNHAVEIVANTTLYASASYEAKYKVTVTSIFLSSPREDWLNAGESLAYGRRSSPQDMNGTLGFLGGKWVFDGWYENGQYLSDSTDVLITVSSCSYSNCSVLNFIAGSGPIFLEARWRPDYTIPIVILGAIAIVAGASIFFVRRITEIISQSTKGVEKGVQRNFRKHRIKILLLACVLIAIMVGAVYLQYWNSAIDQTKGKSIYANSQFVVSARDSQGCHVQRGVFQAADNQTFYGSVKSSQPIDFLILSQNSYDVIQNRLRQNNLHTDCTNKNGYFLDIFGLGTYAALPLYQTDVTEYEFNWQSSQAGTYYFVFFNRGIIDASVTFNAWTN